MYSLVYNNLGNIQSNNIFDKINLINASSVPNFAYFYTKNSLWFLTNFQVNLATDYWIYGFFYE